MTRSLSRSIGWTFVSEAAAVAATAWVTRQLAARYAEREVDAYFVVRQVLSWVISVGLFGLNVSLPRAIARDPSTDARRRQVVAALVLSAPPLGIIAGVALFLPSTAARVLLYDAAAAPLLVAASALFCANALFGVAAASLQGLDRFGRLAALRIAAHAVAPTAAVVVGARVSLPIVLAVWAGAVAAIDLALFALVAAALRGRGDRARVAKLSLAATSMALMRFGGARMVGALAQLAMVALGPTLVLWAGGDARVAAAMSVAAMFTVLLAPLRRSLQAVALTQLASLGGSERARRLAIDYFATAVRLTAAATVALAMTADRVVAAWLGERYAAESMALRLSIVVVGLHFFCYTLEGALDAEDERDARPRAQLAALFLFVPLAGASVALHFGWRGLIVAQLVAAAFQTARYVGIARRRYGLPPAGELLHALIIAAGCSLVGFFARRALGTVALVGVEGLTALALVLIARPAVLFERSVACAASAEPSRSTAETSNPGSRSG